MSLVFHTQLPAFIQRHFGLAHHQIFDLMDRGNRNMEGSIPLWFVTFNAMFLHKYMDVAIEDIGDLIFTHIASEWPASENIKLSIEMVRYVVNILGPALRRNERVKPRELEQLDIPFSQEFMVIYVLEHHHVGADINQIVIMALLKWPGQMILPNIVNMIIDWSYPLWLLNLDEDVPLQLHGVPSLETPPASPKPALSPAANNDNSTPVPSVSLEPQPVVSHETPALSDAEKNPTYMPQSPRIPLVIDNFGHAVAPRVPPLPPPTSIALPVAGPVHDPATNPWQSSGPPAVAPRYDQHTVLPLTGAGYIQQSASPTVRASHAQHPVPPPIDPGYVQQSASPAVGPGYRQHPVPAHDLKQRPSAKDEIGNSSRAEPEDSPCLPCLLREAKKSLLKCNWCLQLRSTLPLPIILLIMDSQSITQRHLPIEWLMATKE